VWFDDGEEGWKLMVSGSDGPARKVAIPNLEGSLGNHSLATLAQYQSRHSSTLEISSHAV
jgi:hypothetical protein